MHPAIRHALGFVTIVTIVHFTVATPTAVGQAAKPNACELVDAAELLKLTGRKDRFGKGPQVQDPTEIPQHTSGCDFLGILFLLDTPFAPERFARALGSSYRLALGHDRGVRAR